MPKFTTIVSEVEAFKLSEDTKEALQKFMGGKGDVRPYLEHQVAVVVETSNGVKVALPGDYVYKKGQHFEVASAAEFEAVYEAKAAKA